MISFFAKSFQQRFSELIRAEGCSVSDSHWQLRQRNDGVTLGKGKQRFAAG